MVDAALQNTTREASEALLRGTRMDGRKRTGVARIQKLQEVEGFPAPDFAQQNPVGPMPSASSQ